MRRDKTALQYVVTVFVLLSTVFLASEEQTQLIVRPMFSNRTTVSAEGEILATFCIDSKHGIRIGKWSILI